MPLPPAWPGPRSFSSPSARPSPDLLAGTGFLWLCHQGRCGCWPGRGLHLPGADWHCPGNQPTAASCPRLPGSAGQAAPASHPTCLSGAWPLPPPTSAALGPPATAVPLIPRRPSCRLTLEGWSSQAWAQLGHNGTFIPPCPTTVREERGSCDPGDRSPNHQQEAADTRSPGEAWVRGHPSTPAA